ncbi:ribosome hibernation-promoting factor, HPF/YfiA family [Candidatus Anaplasma sp. TIGMIC]|uniref:ribosome hibernation-promoting factor, HPF/YfiA family n=1 Tax=Candidatus Anaplasma sp. TIGMIC TaxID=3020713 RepID=UPI00232A8D4F|nr:ribosome-associated translation inhibitor RaiA [Candidatus Anaplasma sp. TIGMIC]MDB1135815.1 ribosome-associated translation inhibitor RaiA [Candidatus Anaplasma sp. TIGMIC]
MNIIIACRGYSVTDSIKSYIETNLESHIVKYLRADEMNARVVLSKEGHLFTSSVSIYNESQHEFIKASEKSDTVYKAIDASVSHIVCKLKKYKSERIDKYRKSRSLKDEGICKGYLLNTEDIGKSDIEDSPLIVEEEISLKKMSVSDAVMEMELLSIPAVLFINSKTNKINMVYAKDDCVVWVDPLDNTLPK